ncbi:MAG TPA: hypothetical protein VHV77_15055, partial [Pirellulales bacterium]|nr:hypothetical protein [Pirellulales bacterium]
MWHYACVTKYDAGMNDPELDEFEERFHDPWGLSNREQRLFGSALILVSAAGLVAAALWFYL